MFAGQVVQDDDFGGLVTFFRRLEGGIVGVELMDTGVVEVAGELWPAGHSRSNSKDE